MFISSSEVNVISFVDGYPTTAEEQYQAWLVASPKVILDVQMGYSGNNSQDNSTLYTKIVVTYR